MKRYIIQLTNKTYFRYGGNTRDIKRATFFSEVEDNAINSNLTMLKLKYKNAKLIAI